MMKGMVIMRSRPLKSRLLHNIFLEKQLSTTSSSTNAVSGKDSGKVFVVSGASRGLGLEFTRQLLSSTHESTIIALSRPASHASLNAASRTDYRPTSIQELQKSYPTRLHWFALDLTSQSSIDQVSQNLTALCSNGVHLLINSAAILGDNSPEQPGPERSLNHLDRSWLMKSLEVNLVGHIMLTKALLPLLQKPHSLDKGAVSRVVNMSARVGSIEDNK